jgi:beta-N-acetylhexosaminidase
MSVTVMADILGTSLSIEDIEFILQPELSGLILFSRNYESKKQLIQLVDTILSVRPDFLLTVDQEGGRVQRFREGFLRLPAMLVLENQYLKDSEQALLQANSLGWLMASELIECRVDLSFAPVLDINYNNSSVIGDRSFSSNSERVLALSRAFIQGMNKAGMSSCAKHFPGHGYVQEDSHLELPVDNRTIDEMTSDIYPFKELMSESLIQSVMPAHVLYSKSDENHTAGFSTFWLQTILRKKLGFNGVIFSDDLSMFGAATVGKFESRAQCAYNAGCNVLLACNDREGAQEVIDTVRANAWPLMNLLSLKPTVQFTNANITSTSEWAKKYATIQMLLKS